MPPDHKTRGSPRIVSERMDVVDITEEFTKAATALNTGQLVKDEYFTLFEAVGALEIMDSKMDSGYLAPGETLDDDYDVSIALLPEEVVGIMDQLLCHEVAWHMGHPLSQTVFTSIYLDRLLWPVPATLEEAQFDRRKRPGTSGKEAGEGEEKEGSDNAASLVDVVLRAYCLALIKACDRVNSRVSAEYYFEEEDFVTQLYNRKLLSEFDSKNIHAIINEALAWLDKETGTIDCKVKNALTNRLLFRREFLSALDLDTSVIQTRSTEHLVASLCQVSLIQESMPLGKAVDEAFSLKIQRRLASTVPPRPMVKISPEVAIEYLKRFCQDAIDAQQILDYRGPHNLQVAVWALQSRHPQPSVYIRSLVQSFLVHDMEIIDSIPVKDFFYHDLAELVLPFSDLLDRQNEEIEIPSDSRFQIAKHMDNFVKRAAQPFVDTYRTACLNRCRIRRTLCHTIVEWDNLQVEAEDFDVHFRALTQEPPIVLHGGEPTYSYPLSSWAYHQKLRQLRLVLQLGFELSIYSPEELPGMYWYLSHICSTHLGHLDRIRACVTAEGKKSTPSNRVGLNRKPEAIAAERKRAFDRTFALLSRLATQLIAIDAFAIALHALYTLLLRYGLLPLRSLPPSQRYSSDKLRYELRMKPFLPISLPDIVPFETFEQESTLADTDDDAVLDRALRAVAEARKSLEKQLAGGPFLSHEGDDNGTKEQLKSSDALAIEECWKQDVKDSLRACIGASIAISVVNKAILSSKPLSTATKGSNTLRPKLNLSVEIPEIGSKGRWHAWWVVPKVMEVIPLRDSREGKGGKGSVSEKERKGKGRKQRK